MKRIVFLPDSQFDSHDKKLHALFVEFLRLYKPDGLVHVGDFLDCKAPARWSRGTADEFAGTLQGEIDAAKAWLAEVRRVYSGPFAIKQGNHDLRIQVTVNRNAPSLGSLSDLKIEKLLGLEGFGVTWHPGAIDVAPGWVCLHGHEGSLSRYAGGTAIGLARKVGKSVITGHTHRAGIINESHGYGGKMTTLTGVEIGHSMQISKASYLPLLSANWQQALAVLYVDGNRVTPSLIPVINGGFTVEGVRYQ